MDTSSAVEPSAAAEIAVRQHRRRRAPSQAEQERRKAWGREWGRVGAEHAKLIRAREG